MNNGFRADEAATTYTGKIHEILFLLTIVSHMSPKVPQAYELLDFGAKRRAVAATQMNATSSRRKHAGEIDRCCSSPNQP